MNILFRPIEAKDLEGLYQLALNAGYGLTTLPKNKEELKKRIQRSLDSFSKKVSQPINENYLFVLEDLSSKKIIGTSAIEAFVGHTLPFYAYRLSNVSNICHTLDLKVNYHILMLNNDLQGASEICTLYLEPDYRKEGNGLLLSRARFLFMALMPERFGSKIIAEMRGISDNEGNSPFWDSFGKHFFKMSFSKADELSVLTNKQFISDLLPQHPVHVNLLSKDAQRAIGQPHKSTVPAMKILEKEGFSYRNYVDIFDAGPALQVKTSDLNTLKTQRSFQIKALGEDLDGLTYFIANSKIDFKAILAKAVLDEDGITLLISDAHKLGVEVGDKILITQ